MQNPKDDKGQPTAREQALARRAFNMREVLGMRMPRPLISPLTSPIVAETEKTPRDPATPICE